MSGNLGAGFSVEHLQLGIDVMISQLIIAMSKITPLDDGVSDITEDPMCYSDTCLSL